ncbi:MAG TPA: hypothetical protein VGU68_12050 [Ktedonobacteraceae bacterium]|nr:hypothetical protein [Ktedonobacteraceae bacterium]
MPTSILNEIYFVCDCLLMSGIILFTIRDFLAYIHTPRSERKKSLTAWLVIKLVVMPMLIWMFFIAIFHPGSITFFNYTSTLAISSQLFWSGMTQPVSPFFQRLSLALKLLALAILLYLLATWAFAPFPHFR